MRKVIESTLVSLDGVVGEPHTWTGDHFSEKVVAQALDQLTRSDAMIMGRNTYDVYASAWPNRDGVYADLINSIPKYVASTTLDNAAWNNTTVIKGDLVTEVARLKQQGGDILMHGFGPVANTLITNGLLDILHLWVHPHFAGVGGPGDLLLNEGNNTRLELIGTRILKSGIVLLSYQVPAGAQGA